MTLNDGLQEENQAYTVRLEMFEGPLDLLLHLIKKNKLNITDIPIALITEQYLEYLKLMKVLNLDIAGEYLLMAATLLHIKSKMLLPASSEGEGEEEEADPRAELVRRLLEYQTVQRGSPGTGKEALAGPGCLYSDRSSQEREEPEEERVEVNLFELLEAFRKVLERARLEVLSRSDA